VRFPSPRFVLVAALAVTLAMASACDRRATAAVAGPGSTTTTTTTTTEQHPTTVAVPAPEPDAVDRTTATSSLLVTLESIPVQPEDPRAGYDRSLFKHWDDVDHDGCDTRCEVLAAQRRPDGSWLSEWDGYTTNDPSELDIDHVVALAEAWDSGADRWTAAQRDDFADYQPNLLAVTASANTRKGDRDAAEWFPSRAEADCLWASTVVRVKAQWSLTVDQAEHDALVNLLHTCHDIAAPAATAQAPTTTLAPTTTTASIASVGSNAACTPGYDPCIPPGPDVDCAGGKGDGPRYVQGPVAVTGSDPYGLDGNHDGVACT